MSKNLCRVSLGLQAIQASFDLTGISPTPCSGVLGFSDGSTVVAVDAFSIVAGGAPDVWVDIVGFNALRAGKAQTYYITYGNRGLIDARDIVISAGIPLPITVSISDLEPVADQYDSSIAHVLTFIEHNIPAGSSGVLAIQLTIPDLPQYAHKGFTIGVQEQQLSSTVSSTQSVNRSYGSPLTTGPNTSFPFGAGLFDGCSQPSNTCPGCSTQWSQYSQQLRLTEFQLISLSSDETALLSQASYDLAYIEEGALAAIGIGAAVDAIAPILPDAIGVTRTANFRAAISTLLSLGHDLFINRLTGDPADYYLAATNFIANDRINQVTLASIKNSAGVITNRALIEGVDATATLLGSTLTAAEQILKDYSKLEDDLGRVSGDKSSFKTDQANLCSRVRDYLSCAASTCHGSSSSPPPPPPYQRELQISSITSGDPNGKVGILGYGSAGYVSGATPFAYEIQFGNEDNASASAQHVTISDPLDPSDDTGRGATIGPITIGDATVGPQALPGDVSTTLDLRPGINSLVAIKTHLDKLSNNLTFEFQALDPKTNNPPVDPKAGFLPPGVNGSVLFAVPPKSNIRSGLKVQNQATIVFDSNQPISTPVWLNTLDLTAPISKVLSLPATETTSGFVVKWSGIDNDSGVKDYTISSSVDGGAYTAWLTNTATTSATFTGEIGHTYGFYSIATDHVGNVEASKSSPDTTTRIVNAGTLVIAPSAGNFGNIKVGTTSPMISFTVTNNTASSMGYLGFTNLGEFYLQPGSCHLVSGEPMLNPGESCVFTAVFKPTRPGVVSGTLSIQTSSGNFTVPMTGTGTTQ